jgi:hypothetical protein
VDIQLVVSDLDGTLWERDDVVPERTQAALTELEARGVPLLIATGRRVASTRGPLAAIGLAPPAVVLNGGLGLDLATGRRFHRGGYAAGDARAGSACSTRALAPSTGALTRSSSAWSATSRACRRSKPSCPSSKPNSPGAKPA